MSAKHRIDLSTARNGERQELEGRRIEIVGASAPDAEVELCVIYDDGSRSAYYPFQEEYKAYSGRKFKNVLAKNTAQAGEWVEIVVTQDDDEWKYEPRTDLTISQITEPVEIKNDPDATPLDVDDANTQGKLDDVLALLQNANDQRKGLTDLTGASYGAASNTTNTVVSSGANLNGVIIRTASVSASGSTQVARLNVGGSDILKVEGTSGGAAAQTIENIFVPAGAAVSIISSGANSHGTISYEVL